MKGKPEVVWEAHPFFNTDEQLAAARARMDAPSPGANREPVPDKVRNAVYARDGHQCTRCGRKKAGPQTPGGKVILTLDHIIPRSEGGSNEPENLRVLCWQCHCALNRGEWS